MRLKTFVSILVCLAFVAGSLDIASAYDPLATPVAITGEGQIPLTLGPLLDDFGYGTGVNLWGDITGTFSSDDPPTSNARCDVSYEDDPAIAFGKSGRSLKLDYAVSKAKSYAGYFSKLGGADLSSYKYLSFWVKGAAGGEYFKIELKNNSTTKYWDAAEGTNYYRNKAAVYITDYLDGGVTTGWKKVSIPLDAFANLDGWTDTSEFVIVFENSQIADNGSAFSGAVYVDNISFGKTFLGFVRIDHFGDKIGTSALGGNRGEGGDTVTSSFSASQYKSSPNGLSLYYSLPAWGGAWSFSPIGGGNTDDSVEHPEKAGWIKISTDFSAYATLHFWIRAKSDSENPNAMKIELQDDPNYPHASYVLTGITTSWAEKNIALNNFTVDETLNPAAMEQIVFVFEFWRILAYGGDYAGTVYIDDMEFRKAGYAPDTAPPAKPSAPGITGSGILTLTANAASGSTDPTMENVRFEYNDGGWMAIGYDYDTSNTAYSASWDVSGLSPGNYQVRAVAMDASGNETVSNQTTYTR